VLSGGLQVADRDIRWGTVELRILGPFEVLDDDGAPVDVGGSRPQALLIDLALAEGHPVPADRLLDDVWSGDPAPARNRLQVQVSRLRRALGEERITTRGGGYALDLPHDALDAFCFERLSTEGRAALQAGDAQRAATLLRNALDLWRGSALVDFADDAFAVPVITRLEESRLAAIEAHGDAELLLGRHAEMIGELEALVQSYPLREHLWAQLMTALYRAGRQAEALRAYQRARTVLAEQLGIDPSPALRDLEEAVLAQDLALAAQPVPPARAGTQGMATNLPVATTSLIGRAAEMDATVRLVHEHRVTTVVGPGGVGKTRLAMDVGRRLLAEFEHGVHMADLAPVDDAAGISNAIVAALGVEVEVGEGASSNLDDRLSAFLRDRHTLLILDNCEHIVALAAELVDDLVGRCADLRVLATSREPLLIAGEVLWTLAPLEPPDAVALFMERARAVTPSIDTARTSPETVGAICGRLDCLPLAIELAAARMRAFTPDDLLSRLDDRFSLLTTGSRTALPRQQTLRAVIDWSYDLLFDDERRVFERLSLFAGQFGMAAAEAICSDERIEAGEVAELVAGLVDRSLVATRPSPRGVEFRLLQTLAQYGRERLDRAGDAEATRTRHARYVASLVEVPNAAHGRPEGNWYGMIGEWRDDIRLAMEWSLACGDADIACAITGALGWYWNMGGRIDETWQWLTAALALGEPNAPSRRVLALAWAGNVGIAHDSDRAIAYGAEGVERARALGDDAAIAVATMLHGSALSDFFHRTEASAALFDESRRAFERVGDAWGLAMAAIVSGSMHLVKADLDAALPEFEEAATGFGSLGNAWARSTALRHVADIAAARGQYDKAAEALRQAITGLRAVDATGLSSGLVARLAYIAAVQGQPDEADSWFEEALASAEQQHYVPTLALTYNLRGITLRRRGLLDEAERCHRDALALYVDRAAPAGRSLSLTSLGYIAELRGDDEGAERFHIASLDAADDAGDVRAEALALEGLAGVASVRGDDEGLGRYLGAAEALRDMTGGPLVNGERVEVERALERVSRRAAMEAALVVGRTDPYAAVALALAAHRGLEPDVSRL
jgi:predicted ATPase/DNA-binding SARP family transcriptional activator